MSAAFWVYVILGRQRITEDGEALPGRTYVGMTSDPARRLRQHNGELANGAKSTRPWRPWRPLALYGPYGTKSEALRAERALKRKKRGINRARWLIEDSPLCRGDGPNHPWVSDHNWKPLTTNTKEN